MLTPEQILDLKEHIYKNVELGINRYTHQMNVIRYTNGYIKNDLNVHDCMCTEYKYTNETKTYTFRLLYLSGLVSYFDISIRKYKLLKIFK